MDILTQTGQAEEASAYINKHRKLRSVESRRNSLRWGRTHHWIVNTKWSALKMYIERLSRANLCIQKYICTSTYTHIHIYAYKCLHITTMNGRRGYEFAEKQERIYGRISREEGKEK